MLCAGVFISVLDRSHSVYCCVAVDLLTYWSSAT